MATAGDGAAPYGGVGSGGKFQKKPFRRGSQATPYDRPPTALRINSPTLLTKLVDPVSRVIYAGANKLFGVFHKRLSPRPSRRLPEINGESENGLWVEGPKNCGVSECCTDQDGNMGSVSATTVISELEKMLKHKKFTRSEIERLTTLLHSRTTESPSDDVVEREGVKISNTASHLLRTETSTYNGTPKQLGEERVNFAISTPVDSRVLKEDFASPAELAKAYMGTRPTNLAPSAFGISSQPLRQDSVTPKTTNSFRALENGFTTPRSRGRSTIYTMSCTPYSRGLSTFGQKNIKTDYGHGEASPSLILSQPARQHEGPFGFKKKALKRRYPILDDDIGCGGPMRRIRHKADLLSQRSFLSKHRGEFGSHSLQQPGAANQQLLLTNEHEQKASKSVEENGETSMSSLGYASVPTKSIQMATKILQQLERLSPKEKSSRSRLAEFKEKSPTKLTSNMLHGQALRILDEVDSPKFQPSPQNSQKPEVQQPDDANAKGKDKAEENDSRKFAVPCNMLNSLNRESTVPLRDNAPFISTADSKLKLLDELPQEKHTFQMGVHEIPLELDEEIHSNEHSSIPLDEDKKMHTSLVANKDVSTEALSEVTQTPALHKTTPAPPEVAEIPALPEFNKFDENTLPTKTEFGPSSSTITQSVVLSQSASLVDRDDSQKDLNACLSFGVSDKGAEKVSPFVFSSNDPSVFKPDSGPVPNPVSSNSMSNSVEKNDQVKFSASEEDGNVNGPKPVNLFTKSDFLSSATSSGMFPFGASTMNSSITKEIPTSNPPIFSSSPSFPSTTNINQIFNHTPSHVTSSGSTTTVASTTTSATTSAASSNVFSISSPAPIFSFASATAPSTLDLTASTSTTNTQSQGSFFTAASGSQAYTQASTAVTQAVPFQFASSAPTLAFGATGTSTTSIFGSPSTSAHSFGLSPVVASSDTKSGTSTTSIFDSPSTSAHSFGLSPVVASSDTKSGTSTTSIFGSPFSFAASSTSLPSSSSAPILFSSSNTDASNMSSMFSFASPGATNPHGQTVFGNLTPGFGSPNNSMEDSMAEDSMPSPAPTFGQPPEAAPEFVFGSANSFQFGGQPNQAFAGGGSFSLGSGGGGDKSGRRFLRVKSKNRRK